MYLKYLRPIFFMFIGLFLLAGTSYAQLDCSNTFNPGLQGSFNLTPGLCAPVNATIQVRFGITAFAAGHPTFDPNLVQIRINWNDPADTRINYATTEVLPGVFEVIANFNYPAGPTCTYTPTAFPVYNGAVCSGGSLRQTQTILAYATENFNGGNVNLNPQLEEVCLGEDVNVVIDDVTTFNCNVGIEPNFPNERDRHMRFVYGDPANPNRIPNIEVGGVPVTNGAGNLLFAGGYTAPFIGGSDAFGVFLIPDPALGPTQMTLPIFAASGSEAVGDEFLVTVEYWNVCNPYSGDPGTSPAPETFQAIIRIIDAPPPPAAADQDYCETAIGNLTAAGTGGTLTWYDDAGLTNVVGTGGNFAHGETAPGVYTFYVTETAGNNCEGPATQVDLEIWDNVSNADAGPNQTICDVNSTNLAANNPAVGTGEWTVLVGTGVLADPFNRNTLVTNLSPGENRFRWRINNGPGGNPQLCTDFDNVSVFRDITPNPADAGPDQDVCDLTSVVMAGNAASDNSTGRWKVVTGSIWFESFNNLPNGTTTDGPPTGWTTTDGSPGNTNVFSVQDHRIEAGGTRGEVRVITDVINISAFPSVDVSVDVANNSTGQFEGADYVQVRYILDGGPATLFATNGNNTGDFPNNVVASQTGLSGTTLQIQIRIRNSADNEVHFVDDIFVYETPSGALPTFTNPTSPTTTVNGLLQGVNEFMWEITSQYGLCGVTADTVVVTRDLSVVAVAGPDQTICNDIAGVSTFLDADAAINNGTGTWSVIAGTGVFADANDPDTEVTGLTVGISNIYRWTVDSELGICPTVTDDVDIFVDPTFGATADAGADQTICSNETATMAGAFGGSASSITWTTSGDGSFDNPNDPNAIYTPGAGDIAGAPQIITLTITTDIPAPCPAAFDRMDLTINPTVTANDVNTSLCETVSGTGIFQNFDLTSLEGSINGGGGITYSYFTDVNLTIPVAVPTSEDVTTTAYFVLVDDGACTDTAQLNFTIIALPTANDRNPIDLCEDTAGAGTVAGVDLTAEEGAINGGGGITYSYFEDANLTIPVATPANVTVSNGDDFFVLVDDGTCADTALIFYNVATLPTANDVVLNPCEETAGAGLVNNFDLTASEGAINGGGGITYSYFEDVNLTIPVATPASVTVNNGDDFFVLVDDGNCQDTAQMTFNVQTLPTANDVALDLCEDTPGVGTVAAVDLTANEGAINGGGGIVYSYFEDANLTVPVATPGNVTVSNGDDFFVLVSDGTCPDTAQIDYTVFTQATVNAAAVATVIIPGSTIDLSPSTSGGSTTSITWTTSGDGTFIPDATTLGATYDPGVADETGLPNTITLTLTSDDPAGPCPAGVSTVDITIADPATADAGPDQEICADATSTMAGSIGGTATSLTWTSSGDGSFNDPTLANAIYTPGPGDIAAAPTTITLTITTDDPDGGGPILPATDDMLLTINPLPVTAVPVGTGIGCVNDIINYVIPGAPVTSTYAWDLTDLPGAVITAGGDPSPFITLQFTSALAGRSLTVTETETATSTNCVGLPVTLGGITIFDPPTTDAGSNETTCEGVAFDLATSATIPSETDASSVTWSHNGTGFFTDPNILLPVYNPGVGETGVVTLTITAVGSGGCPDANDNMLLTINPQATVNAGLDQITCENTVLNLNGVVGGTFTDLLWTSSTGNGTFSDATIANPTYTADPADFGTTITLRLTASDASGTCPDVFDELDLIINQIPVVDAGAPQSLCEGDVVNLTGTVSVPGYTVLWTGGTGAFADPTNVNTTYTPGAFDVGAVVLTLTASDPLAACADVADNVTITFVPPPTSDAGSDEETCEGVPFDLSTSTSLPAPADFSSLNWTHNGTGSFDNPALLTPIYTPGVGETGIITLTLEALGNSTCASAFDDMQLTITPAPTANAGSDEEICEGVAFNLSTSAVAPTATEFSSLMWTTSGTGVFNNNTLLTPIYIPGAGDEGTTVTLTLEAFGNGSCTSVTDDMQLTVTLAPVADAGSDEETCQGIPFDLSTAVTPATEANGSSRMWTHTGTGSFDDPTLLTPIYTPGAGETGIITLTLEIFGNGSCTSVTDDMQLTITPFPTVNAGSDEEVCEGAGFNLSGSAVLPNATQFSSLLWTSSGTGTFNNATLLTPIYTPGPGDEGTVVTLTIEAFGNGSCPSVTDDMQLTVTLGPVANAGSDEETCEGVAFDLSTSATVPTEANSSSRLWSHTGTGSFDNPTLLTPIYTPGPGETGNITLTLEIFGNGSCTSVTDDMILTITPLPIVDAGSDEETCEGVAYNLAGSTTLPSAANVSALNWTHTGTGSFDDPTLLLPTYTPGVGETGVVTFTLEGFGNGSCPSATDNMTLTITPAPIVDAGSDEETCQGVPFDLSTSATLPSELNGNGRLWSHSGTGSFDDPTLLTPIYTPGPGETGFVTFTLEVFGNGSCTSATDIMVLSITAPPIVFAGSDEETCEGVPFDISTSGVTPLANNFNTLQWTTSGTGTFDDPTLLTPIYTPGVGETGFITLTLEAFGNGSCPSLTDDMVLTVTPAAAANAGSDEETCEGVPFDMAGAAVPATASNFSLLQWTSSGSGNFNNNTLVNPIYIPGPTDAGTVVTLTLQAFGNGTCVNVIDDMQLTVTAAPTANAGSDEETCEAVPFDLSTSVTVPSETNGSSRMWTHTGTGSFDDPTLLTPIYTPGVGETGLVTLTLEVFGNGSCVSALDNMILNITPAAVVDAGSDEETCEGALFDLSSAGTPATAGNFSALLWTTSGTGTFNNASLLTPIYFPSAADAGAVVTLTLEAFGNGSCVSATDAMQLTITSAVVVDAGSNEETCEGVGFDLGTSAVIPSASNFSSLMWTTSGTGTFDDATLINPTYTPGVGETGAVVLTLEAFGNGSCPSVTDFMTLTITPAPIVDAGSDSETCEGVAFNLVSSAVVPSASNVSSLMWTHTGTGSFNDPTILLPTYTPGVGESGVITLTLEGFGNGSCVSLTDNMQLTITAAPIVDAGSDEETCQGVPFNLAGSAVAPSESNTNGTRLWSSTGTGSFDDATALTPIYTPGIGESGAITLTLTVFGNGSCTPASDNMVLTITPLPSAFAGSDQETCENVPFDISTSGLLPIANNFSSLMWTTSGTGTFDDPTLLTPIYTPGAGETGVITLTLEAFGNGSCVSATDDMLLTVTPAVIVDAGSDEETCEGIPFDLSTSATIPSVSNFSGVQWTTSGSGNFTNSSTLTPLYIPGPTDAGTVVTLTLEAFGNGSCVSITDNMQLTVTLAPIANAGSDEETCEGVPFDLSTSGIVPTETNGNGTRMWTTTGTGSFDDPTLLTPIYTPGVGESGVIALSLEVFGNGSCASSIDNMTLIITPAPIVDAGSDEETCEGVLYDLSTATTPASAGNFSGVQWTTSGTGSFNNASLLTPIYFPGAADAGTVVTLTLEVFGNGSCVSVTDNMQLTITLGPIADAGTDEETCEGVPFDLSTSASVPAATNFSSVLWTHNGVGSFNDPTLLTPIYTPGVGETGTIDLSLEVFGNGSCTSVTDAMRLTITPAPLVDAGSDEETCEGVPFLLSSSAVTPSASNFSSVMWTHNGTGSFSDPTQLISIYTPGAGETGVVTLTLEVFGNGSCVSTTDNMQLTITPAPIADAGSDEETCEAVPFDFSTSATLPSAANSSSVFWTSNGAGTINDPTLLTPIYTPAGGETGLITFTLEVFGNGSCISTTDIMQLTITPLPTAFAGTDEETCELVPFNLATSASPPNASNFSSVLWTSSGAGTFDDATSLTPTYTPAIGETGATTLTLEVFGNGSCVSVTDDMILTITPAPVADAGSDEETCETVPFDLSTSGTVPTVSNELSFFWSHNGSGSFNNPGLLTPIYTPGVGETGAVTLTLNATGNGSCVTVMDDMVLTITPLPVVDAGSNEQTCEGVPFDLSTSAVAPTVTNFSTLMWTTSGAGSFDDPTLLTPIYTPGAADAGTTVTLTLEAFGNGSCFSITNSMDLAVLLQPVVTVPPADVTLCETENTTFGVSLNPATGLSFQWEEDNGSGSGFLPIADGGIYFGTGTATLSIFNAPDTINGYQYRLVVTNVCGTDISAPATLTVNTGPEIVTQPSNNTVCENENAIFEVIASGTGLTFQWQENSGGGFFDIVDGPLFTGTNTSQLTVNNVSLAQSSNQYRVMISGACVPPLLQQISSPVVLLVDQLPAVVVDPTANPICDGDNLTLQVTAIGTGITYQWEEDSGSGFVAIADGGVYSGTNTPNLTLSSVPDTFDGNIYRVRVSGTCTPPAISANVPITVHSLPTASFVGVGDACTGASLVFTLSGVGPFDVTYNNGTSNTTLIGISDGHVEVVTPSFTTTYTLVSVLDSNAPRCSGIVDPTPTTIIGLQNISALIDVVPNTPQIVNVNTTFAFDASGTTTAIPIANLTFDWDFGDGNTISGMGTNPVNITHPDGSVTTGTFLQPTHTYLPNAGNYFVNLTISYGQCSSSTTNGVSLEPVPPTVDFTFTPDDGCSPLTVQFFEQAEFEDPNSYFWNFGDGTFSAVGEANPVHVYTDPGIYTVSLEVTNSIGVIVQEIKNEIIQVNELPVAIFRTRPLEVVEIPDQVLETSNLSFGADIYTWQFVNPNDGVEYIVSGLAGSEIDTVYADGASTVGIIDNPTHTFVSTGIFDVTLIAESALGCADTVSTVIEVIEADDIRVPNVFTPSSGGPNDSEGNVNENLQGGENSNNIFIPVFRDVVDFHMQIFDRWGNLIFESFSEDRGWDGYYKGRIAQSDVYVYKVVVRLKNNEVVTSIGDVTLVR